MNMSESESWMLCCDGVCRNPGGVHCDCCPVMRSGRDDGHDESVRGHGREVVGTHVSHAKHAVKVPLSL